MDQTLAYYAENADDFAKDTLRVDFSATRERFLSRLEPGAAILDLGCGAGRDAKAFLERGFRVTAVDGSPELCALASAYLGIPVRRQLFQDLTDQNAYDGIWACASILHLTRDDLTDVFRRIITALKPEGIIYTSFKYGTFEGIRSGRRFIDFTEAKFSGFLKQFPELTLIDQWVTSDVRPGRADEHWLNAIMKYGI